MLSLRASQTRKCKNIAISAHGYILLAPEQEKSVTEPHNIEYVGPEMQCLGSDELDEHSSWHRGRHRDERTRAIAKDFVEKGTPNFGKSQIPIPKGLKRWSGGLEGYMVNFCDYTADISGEYNTFYKKYDKKEYNS